MPTHGSLSKAGKVRSQTPKVGKTSQAKSKIPRVKNRRKYIAQVLLKRPKEAMFDPREKKRR